MTKTNADDVTVVEGNTNDAKRAKKKKSKKKKKRKSDEKSDKPPVDTYDGAMTLIKNNSKKRTIQVSVTSAIGALPLTIAPAKNKENPGELVLCIANCNHNEPNALKTYQLMNQILDNVFGVENRHERTFGNDGQLLLTEWDQVSQEK